MHSYIIYLKERNDKNSIKKIRKVRNLFSIDIYSNERNTQNIYSKVFKFGLKIKYFYKVQFWELKDKLSLTNENSL